MSQISPPLRIVLVGAVLFMAAWFTMLKPGEETAPPATAPTDPAAQAAAAADGTNAGQPASAAGQAVQQAQQGAATAGQAAQQRAGEAPSAQTATAPGTAAAAAPKDAKAAAAEKAELVKSGLPAEVAAAMDDKVVALAFVNDDAADDRRVRGAMRKVYDHEDKVFVKTASIKDVSKYAPITRGANVDQSPTVLVIDRHRAVTPLVGYVDSVSINQAVIDALLVDGSPLAESKYLQKLEGLCAGATNRVEKLRDPKNFRQFKAFVADVTRISDNLAARVARVKAPKEYRSLHRDLTRLVRTDQRIVKKFNGWVRTGQFPVAAVTSLVDSFNAQYRRLDLRLAGLGMEDCRDY